MSNKNSVFTEEVIAAELYLAKKRVRFDVIAGATERFKREGKDSLVAVSAARLVEAHADLMAARQVHLGLIKKAEEHARCAVFKEAYDLWVNGTKPYDNIVKFPNVESVIVHLTSVG